MTSVWIVHEDDYYSRTDILGVFDNKEAAQTYASEIDVECQVEEHVVASVAPVKVARWHGQARRSGGWVNAKVSFESYLVWPHENGPLSDAGTAGSFIRVSGPDRVEVEKVLTDRLAAEQAREAEFIRQHQERRKAEKDLRSKR